MSDLGSPSGDDLDGGRTRALRLAALLAGAGVLHVVAPRLFDPLVPAVLPGRARTWTHASGVAELAAAALLAAPRTRRSGGTVAAAVFVAVYPANLDMARRWVRSDRTSAARKAVALARLPLQVPLVTEALRVRREAGPRSVPSASAAAVSA